MCSTSSLTRHKVRAGHACDLGGCGCHDIAQDDRIEEGGGDGHSNDHHIGFWHVREACTAEQGGEEAQLSLV